MLQICRVPVLYVCMYECVGYAASVITQHTTPPPLRETSEAKVEETLMQ